MKKYGYTYTLSRRGDKALLYEITTGKHVIGYEVMKIVITRPKNIHGILIPARERFARERDFGITAWDFTWQHLALEKFKELEKN